MLRGVNCTVKRKGVWGKGRHTPVVWTPPVGAILEENCWFEFVTAAVELWSFAALILKDL